jgi:DNA-binding transcriptional ArsR family regulator
VFSILGDDGMGKPKLDYAMKVHMQRIVLIEGRPFCFRDFLDFEVDGKKYKMKHGTIRNKISKLKKNGLIQLEYYSGPAFYSLKGVSLTKPKREMTDNHTVVPQLSSVSFIDNLPSQIHSVHDIRLRFIAEGIWSTIRRTHPELTPNEVSKDISLLPVQMHNLEAKTVIHHSDTVSIIVACSMKPVVVDNEGLIRLSNILTSVEERLSALVTGCAHSISPSPQIDIPNHDSWTVTMWHFGTDSLNEYAGEKFEMTWENGEHALLRIYSKDMRDGVRIRKERQEYPDVRLDAAVYEKLHT